MADSRLRATLERDALVTAPGVYDLISARIADRMGFAALYATGFGMVASHLGLPDAGLATFTDMVGRAGAIARACATPVIADADTGYGGLLNVRHTVQAYEAAGIAAIQIEDQESPKKCGHTPGRRVIPLEEFLLKIAVAVEARKNPDFLIVARTDARTALGLEEAIRRGKAFAEAGADVVFVESPETEAEMEAIGQAIRAPLLANIVEGGRTPVLPAARLRAIGYRIAIFPALGFLPAAAALEAAYTHLLSTGSSVDLPTKSFGFGRMTELMGFPEVHAFESRWTVAPEAEQS